MEYVARALVDSPEEVRVEEDWSGNHAVLHLFVAEEDMGKVIGKQGRIAQALRSLLKVSAMKHDIRAILEIGQ